VANNDTSIQVAIQANIKDLQKKLTRAEGRLKQFDKVSGQATKQTAKFGKTVSANAVPAMTSFSQVIQDAPFGIRGVANNITQLTAQFGHLQKRTGGAKAALKSMLSTLAGPAGILLAVSVVTSLLVSYGDTLFKTKKKTEDLKGAQDELNKSFEKYKESLTAINKARVEGEQNAARELTTLTILVKQAENVALSTDKRKEAIDELRKKYPSYLKGMTDEKALADGLSGVYDKLSTSILKKAKAQAASDIITENTKEAIKLEGLLAQQKQATIDKQKEANKASDLSIVLTKAGNTLISDKEAAQIKVNESKVKEGEIQEQINELQKESLELANQLAGSGDLTLDPGGKGKGKEDALIAISKFAEAVNTNLKGVTPIVVEESKKIKSALIDAVPTGVMMSDKLGELLLTYMDFDKKMKALIDSTATNTFAGLGEAIGEALSTGGNVFSALGKSILMSVGNFLKDFGKLMIQYGVTALAFSKASTALLNPITAGPAAVALIATGVALTAIGSAIKGTLSGGGGGSGSRGSLSTDFSQGSQGASSFGGSSVSGGDFRGGNVVFEIAGTKLVGVLSNTLNKNKALGGNNTLSLT
jgi:hypothetical protein